MTYAVLYPYFVLTCVLSYFIGNINFAILISKAKGKDIRDCGSGNPGTMNMLRNNGAVLGIATLLLDGAKGFVPTFVAGLVFSKYVIGGFDVADMAMMLAGFSACLGHVFPVFLKFKGGKGVATVLGMFIALSPLFSIVAFFVGVGFILLVEYGSYGCMMFLSAMATNQGVSLASKYVAGGEILCNPIPYFVTCVVLFATIALVWVAHKSNIKGLISGTEHKTKLRTILFGKIAKMLSEKSDGANA